MLYRVIRQYANMLIHTCILQTQMSSVIVRINSVKMSYIKAGSIEGESTISITKSHAQWMKPSALNCKEQDFTPSFPRTTPAQHNLAWNLSQSVLARWIIWETRSLFPTQSLHYITSLLSSDQHLERHTEEWGSDPAKAIASPSKPGRSTTIKWALTASASKLPFFFSSLFQFYPLS